MRQHCCTRRCVCQLTCQVNPIRCEAVSARAACVEEAASPSSYTAQRLNVIETEVQPGIGGTLVGQSIARDPLVCTIDDEEQPEELVEALGEDVLPHAAVDDGLLAPMRLCQQQVRGGRLSCQCCSAYMQRCQS